MPSQSLSSHYSISVIPMQKAIAVIASAIVVVMLSSFGTLTAFATLQPGSCSSAQCPNQTPSGTMSGQKAGPTNTCPGTSGPPGNSANNNGAPFSSTGQAGNVYAGNPGTASLQHSNSGAPISQYDNACFH